MKPKAYHQIEDFQDLQMAKYKLRLALDYSEKRMHDQYAQLKSHMTFEKLGKEVGQWAVQKLSSNGHAPAESSQITTTTNTKVSKTAQWLEFLPIILSGIFSAIQLFSNQPKS